MKHIHNVVFYVFPIEYLLTLAIDDLTLLVHHVVILQDVLANLKISSLHTFLRVFNRIGQHFMFNRLVFFQAQRLNYALDSL